MAWPFITQAHLEQRIGAKLVRRILDDDNDGEADEDNVDRIARDASATVADELPTYSRDELSALTGDAADSLIRVTLDVAAAYAAQRHPEVVRREWEPLMKHANERIKALRSTMAKLPTPSQPANEGARVTSGNPDDSTIADRFSDNWGDY